MIIGIDGNEANVERRVGVGKYGYELLRQFYKFHVPSLNFRVYLKDGPLADLPKETDWWQYKRVGPRKFWTQIGLPLVLYKPRSRLERGLVAASASAAFKDSSLKGRRVDVFFTPTHYAPRFCPCPRVISIMDLSFLHFPEMFKKEDLWQLKNWTEYSVRKAAKILTISESSKNDIIRHYRVLEKRVVVTYPGANMENGGWRMENGDKIKEKYGIGGDYILSVGTLQPRKNFVRLIEAFSALTPNPYTLVIVGKPGWLYKEILTAPKKFGVEDKVKFLDFVPDSDLPVLYQGAKCFVLVSLYEGFGLPVLEAMRQGCPVVISNVSSLPEVTGEAGVLVNPNNAQDIAGGILKVLKMGENERATLIKQGQTQAAKFSWEKCAKETLEVLEEVGGRRA